MPSSTIRRCWRMLLAACLPFDQRQASGTTLTTVSCSRCSVPRDRCNCRVIEHLQRMTMYLARTRMGGLPIKAAVHLAVLFLQSPVCLHTHAHIRCLRLRTQTGCLRRRRHRRCICALFAQRLCQLSPFANTGPFSCAAMMKQLISVQQGDRPVIRRCSD